MMATTPSGTRTREIRRPFGRTQPSTTSPTGSASAATLRSPPAIASIRADREASAAALPSAFHDDPVMLHMMPRPQGREKKMRALFLGETRRSLKVGAVHTTRDGSVKGAAIWSAPGKWKLGGLELLGQ